VDVDEVAQRRFVAAFSRLDEHQTDTEFGTWLFTIANVQFLVDVAQTKASW